MKVNFIALSNLKFVLILFVVLIHSNFSIHIAYSEEAVTAFDKGFSIFYSLVLSNTVPVFYMISGFLFYGVKSGSYKDKLQRRVKTLLVPYLLWNTIALITILIKKSPVFADHFPVYQDLHLSLSNVLAGYFSLPWNIYPYDFVLWFIRNLLVVLCVSPLIGLGIKYLHHLLLPVLILVIESVVVGLGVDDRYDLSISLFMFAAGGMLANTPRRSWWIYVAVFLYLSSEAINWWLDPAVWLAILVNFTKYISFSIICIMASYYLVSHCGSLPRRLTDSIFFIYAFHGLFATACCRLVYTLLIPATVWLCVVDYLLCCIVMFGISYVVYLLLKRLMPRVVAILCGFR